MAPFTPLYIGGHFRPSSDNEAYEVRNPFSNQVVGISASASSQDCKDAVEAAANAFTTWEHKSLSEKRDILIKAADIASTDRFTKKVTEISAEETAAVPFWTTGGLASAVKYLRMAAGTINELRGETWPSTTVPGAQVLVQPRAMGVIFSIVPWNGPFTLAIRAIAIPLMCGNTVVLKSSECSPGTQALVAELFEEAGLPSGVLNVISTSREASPNRTAEIIAHPLVRKINFTGSDRVGSILAGVAAKYLKPCVLELGGKAPAIVLDDANVDEAAKSITFAAMTHSGQVCMSTERVIVQRGISQALISAVSALSRGLKAGDPTDPTVKLPPLFSEPSAANVLDMIREAKEAGANLVLGNSQREASVVQPHLLTGVKPGMRIWDNESFGPVLGFAVVDTIDEAVELANATTYSLSASLWTTNVHRAMEIAPRIRAGSTSVNGSTFHAESLLSVMGLGGSTGYGRFDVANFTDKRLIIFHPENAGKYLFF